MRQEQEKSKPRPCRAGPEWSILQKCQIKRPLPVPVVYPDSDGNRMADNTLQYQWIVTIQGELDSAIPDFVAGDLLWYPVEGVPTIRVAPDVMVAPGRPKGHRGSYRQWEEKGVPPKVVWEILSPGNTFGEMQRKLKLYEFYGVDEYDVYDPANQELFGWIRAGDQLVEIPDEELRIYHRDGRRFLSFRENRAEADQERQKV